MRGIETGAAPSKTPRKPPRAVRVPARPLVLAPKPKPVGVFAQRPLSRAGTDSVNRAQRVAAAHVRRAKRQLPTPSVPVVPKLAHPTRVQRQTAKDLAVQSLGRQGVQTRADVEALPALERQRANRALGYARTLDKYDQAQQAARAGVHAPTITGLQRAGQALAAQAAVAAHPGQPHSRLTLGPASVDITSLGRGILGATSLNTGSDENAFLRHALGDVGALGALPVVGGYQVGSAAWELAHGHSGRAKRLGTGLVQGLKTSVPGELLQGHPSAAAESFRQHPVFAALDLAGAVGAVGRVGGALARGAGSTVADEGVRGTLARAGTTVRPAVGINVDGGIAHAQRTYSKDLVRKAAQVTADRARRPLLDADGNPVFVADRGRQVPVLRAHPGESRLLNTRRMDFTASRANARERLDREVTGRDVTRAQAGGQAVAPGQAPVTRRGRAGAVVSGTPVVERPVRGQRIGKRGQQIVSLVTEGTVRPGEHFRPDLEKRLARLEENLADPQAAGYRHTGEVKRAQAEAKAIRSVLANPKAMAQAEKVVQAGQTVGRLRRAQDAEELRLGLQHPRAVERARLMPYAIAHMDGRHFTVEEHQALERSAARVEAAARAKVDGLPKGPERAHALADWRRARQQRIEVSGRDVSGVHAHESARAAHATAQRRVKVAEARVAKLERARHRLSGRQQVQRGTESFRRLQAGAGTPTRARGVLAYIDHASQDEQGLRVGARKEAQRAKIKAKVDGQLATERANLRAAREQEKAARDHAAATPKPDINAGLRRADGRYLPDSEIVAHMHAHGVDPETIGQLSHRQIGNGAFHKRFDLSRPGPGQQRRTGHAYERGASGHGPGQAEETAVNAATRTAQAESVDRAIADNVVRHPVLGKAQRGETLSKVEQKVVDRGGAFTANEAQELAQRLKEDTGREYVAVRLHGAKVSRDTQEHIREQLQGTAPMVPLGDRLLNERLVNLENAVKDPQAGKLRNVGLMPLDAWNRLQRHLAPAGELERAAQMLNRPFRFSVLPQARWLTGQIVEPFLVRLPLSGSGLVNIPGLAADVSASIRTLRDMERSGNPAVRQAAREYRAQQLGGLFIGNRGASNRRRGADSGSAVIRGASFVRHLPVIKQMGDALAWLPNQFFRANRQLIEQWAQHAAVGHQIRADVREITGSWTQTIRLGKKARAEAIRGLVNTPTQERFMRAQHELLGKYEGYGPLTRRLIQTVAPFLPWALSAARFVFWTMPIHHTIATDLLVKSEQVFAGEWAQEHADTPPGDLRLEPVGKDGGYVPLARYTPYGFSGPIVEGDLGGITQQFLPQAAGPEQAIGGKDPFGRALQVKPTAANPKGKPSNGQLLAIALNQLAESMLGPYISTARRLQEKGGTPYADSTALHPKVKPGSSHMSAAQRTFNPFRPTYLHAPAARGGAPAVGGMDAADLHDLQQAAREAAAGSGLDQADLDEIRAALSGR